MKDLFWHQKTAVGWAFYHQNNERRSEKNIVEHNLSFDIEKTRDNPAKTSRHNQKDTNHTALTLKISVSLIFIRKKYSTSHLPNLSPSTNSLAFTRGEGMNVSRGGLLLVDKNVKNKNPRIQLVDMIEKNIEGGA